MLFLVPTVVLQATQSGDCEFKSPSGDFSYLASYGRYFCSTQLHYCLAVTYPFGAITYTGETDEEDPEDCHIGIRTWAEYPYSLPISLWNAGAIVSTDATAYVHSSSFPLRCNDGFCIMYGGVSAVAFGPGSPAFHGTAVTFFTSVIWY